MGWAISKMFVNSHNSKNFCVQFWTGVGLTDFSANICKVKHKLYTLNNLIRLFVENICEIKIKNIILPPAPLLLQEVDDNLVIKFIWTYCHLQIVSRPIHFPLLYQQQYRLWDLTNQYFTSIKYIHSTLTINQSRYFFLVRS